MKCSKFQSHYTGRKVYMTIRTSLRSVVYSSRFQSLYGGGEEEAQNFSKSHMLWPRLRPLFRKKGTYDDSHIASLFRVLEPLFLHIFHILYLYTFHIFPHISSYFPHISSYFSLKLFPMRGISDFRRWGGYNGTLSRISSHHERGGGISDFKGWSRNNGTFSQIWHYQGCGAHRKFWNLYVVQTGAKTWNTQNSELYPWSKYEICEALSFRSVPLSSSLRAQFLEKYEENMKEWRRYEEIWRKYVGNMKEYEGRNPPTRSTEQS